MHKYKKIMICYIYFHYLNSFNKFLKKSYFMFFKLKKYNVRNFVKVQNMIQMNKAF